MISGHYEYLNTASVILGLIGIIACWYGDVPKPYDKVVLWMLPGLIVFNYWALNWLSENRINR